MDYRFLYFMDVFMKFFRGFLLSATFFVSSHAHAIIINDLDWLKLDVTAGFSYNDALTYGAANGYSIANSAQFDAMFSTFVDPNDNKFVDIVGTSHVINGDGSASVHAIPTSTFTLNAFSDAFGFTYEYNTSGYRSISSLGLYADASILRVGGIDAFDFFNSYSVAREYFQFQADFSAYKTHPDTSYSSSIGWFLVKHVLPPSTPVSVPEPSIIALMGLGIFGIGLSRRKMKR